MSLEKIEGNSVTYPTGVYENYNLYLIEEYKKFLDDTKNEKVKNLVKNIINELKELLDDNTPDSSGYIPAEKILNVIDWETDLRHHFEILDISVKGRGKKPIMTMERFLRYEKLKNLDKC